MTWEQYKKTRFNLIKEGKAALPGRKEVLKRIITKDTVWTLDDIIPLFCNRTGIDRQSARENLPVALQKLVDQGYLVEVSQGFYRKR